MGAWGGESRRFRFQSRMAVHTQGARLSWESDSEDFFPDCLFVLFFSAVFCCAGRKGGSDGSSCIQRSLCLLINEFVLMILFCADLCRSGDSFGNGCGLLTCELLGYASNFYTFSELRSLELKNLVPPEGPKVLVNLISSSTFLHP